MDVESIFLSLEIKWWL